MRPETPALARTGSLVFLMGQMNKKLHVVLVIGTLATAIACKKTPPPESSRMSETPTELAMPAPHTAEDATTKKTRANQDPEMEKALDKAYPGDPAAKEAAKNEMRALDALGDAQEKLAEINQRTMVIPASADFRPEPVARKIRLNLILEKMAIKAGENPRFRLELTNVGREPIKYQEYQSSIFKGGSILYSMRTISFYLANGTGNRIKLKPDLRSTGTMPPQHHAAAPKSEKELREINALGQANTTFKVMLRPGDTLRSLGDGDTASEPFRTLYVQGGFKTPGKYHLQVELDDRPRPLSKLYIELALRHSSMDEITRAHELEMKEALGPVSFSTTLEVVR